jgi:hypothetical protein
MALMPFRRPSDERAPKEPHDCTAHELIRDGDVMYCVSHVRAFALLEEGWTLSRDQLSRLGRVLARGVCRRRTTRRAISDETSSGAISTRPPAERGGLCLS